MMMTKPRISCVAWTLLLAMFALAIVIADPVLAQVDGTDDADDSTGSHLTDARLLDLTLDSGDDDDANDDESNDDDVQDTVAAVQTQGGMGIPFAKGLNLVACFTDKLLELAEAVKGLACPDDSCKTVASEEKPGVVDCLNSYSDLVSKFSGLVDSSEPLAKRLLEVCKTVVDGAVKCSKMNGFSSCKLSKIQTIAAIIQGLCATGSAGICLADKNEAELELSEIVPLEQALSLATASHATGEAECNIPKPQDLGSAPMSWICEAPCAAEKKKYGNCVEACKCNLISDLERFLSSLEANAVSIIPNPIKAGSNKCEKAETYITYGKCAVGGLKLLAGIADKSMSIFGVIPAICKLLRDGCRAALQLIPALKIAVPMVEQFGCEAGDFLAQRLLCTSAANLVGGMSLPQACKRQIKDGQPIGYVGCPRPYLGAGRTPRWCIGNPPTPPNPKDETDYERIYAECRKGLLDVYQTRDMKRHLLQFEGLVPALNPPPAVEQKICDGYNKDDPDSAPNCPANQLKYSCVDECVLQSRKLRLGCLDAPTEAPTTPAPGSPQYTVPLATPPRLDAQQ